MNNSIRSTSMRNMCLEHAPSKYKSINAYSMTDSSTHEHKRRTVDYLSRGKKRKDAPRQKPFRGKDDGFRPFDEKPNQHFVDTAETIPSKQIVYHASGLSSQTVGPKHAFSRLIEGGLIS